jgi:hypothetical protein
VGCPPLGRRPVVFPVPQPGCTVGWIAVNGVRRPEPGPQDVFVPFPKTNKNLTLFVDVQCVQ